MIQIIFSIMLLILSSCTQRQTEATPDPVSFNTKECSNLYPFQGYYINLDNLNAELIDGIPSTDFKTCSKYSHKFDINRVSDSVSIGKRSFVLNIDSYAENYEMKVYEDGEFIKKMPLPVASPLPDVHDYSASLITSGDNVILIMEDMYTTHYTLCKYNQEGAIIMQTEFEHTFVTHPEQDTDYHHRYLYFQYITSNQLIFSSQIYFSEKDLTVVVSMEDFSMKTFDKASCGVILDETESQMMGFISEEGDNKYMINLLSGKEIPFELQYGEPYFETLMFGNLLFLSNYHPNASGATLYCYDLSNEKILWNGDVKQPMVGHSEYYNTVTLSMYKDKIIMEGNESYCNYVQIFDAQTGKRLAYFSDME